MDALQSRWLKAERDVKEQKYHNNVLFEENSKLHRDFENLNQMMMIFTRPYHTRPF